MALIKCPECEKEISDKAVRCPNCGYPIMQQVPPIFATASAGKRCKHGTINRNNKFLLLTISSLLCITLLIVVISIFLPRYFLAQNKYYWDNNKWGTTYKKLVQKYEDNIYDSYLQDGDLQVDIPNFNDITGLDATSILGLDDFGSLTSCMILVENNTLKDGDEVLNILYDGFRDKFGKPDEIGAETTIWNADYKWNTEVSDINLVLLDSNNLVIEYSENKVHKEKRQNNIKPMDPESTNLPILVDEMQSYIGKPASDYISFRESGEDGDTLYISSPPVSEKITVNCAGGRSLDGYVHLYDFNTEDGTIKSTIWKCSGSNLTYVLKPALELVFNKPIESEYSSSERGWHWKHGDLLVTLRYADGLDNQPYTYIEVEKYR